MMLSFVISTLVFLGNFASAAVPPSQFCSADDQTKFRQVWLDMKEKGFDIELSQRGIGLQGGDCTNTYGLEQAAERPHKQDAPPPFCGVIAILGLGGSDSKAQAEYVLDSTGKVYTTEAGVTMRICARVQSGHGTL